LSSTRVGMAKPFRDNREFSILGIHHTGPGVAADVRRQTEVKSWGFFLEICLTYLEAHHRECSLCLRITTSRHQRSSRKVPTCC
jgi:hypothetical protein